MRSSLPLIAALWLALSPIAPAADTDEQVWPQQQAEFGTKFLYEGEQLRKNWPALHARDEVPFPDADFVRRASGGSVDDPEAVARQLQEGWRQFHAGNFREAHRIGAAHGGAGLFLAGRAQLAATVHWSRDVEQRRAALRQLIAEFEAATATLGRELYYWELTGRAVVYGQYGRTLSTAQAADEGISETIRSLLDRSLELEPEQPAALAVYGGYHAEIIDRIGGFLAGMMYDASRDDAVKYFERALALEPGLIQIHVEYADALLRLSGKERADRAEALLRRALELEALDAEDALEQRRARRLLEEQFGETVA